MGGQVRRHYCLCKVEGVGSGQGNFSLCVFGVGVGGLESILVSCQTLVSAIEIIS